MRVVLLLCVAAMAFASAPVETSATSCKHVVVFREAGRFAGWPANHRIWSWGKEILVGFEIGYLRESNRSHAIDCNRPAEQILARSLDGGKTWVIERLEFLRPPRRRRSDRRRGNL